MCGNVFSSRNRPDFHGWSGPRSSDFQGLWPPKVNAACGYPIFCTHMLENRDTLKKYRKSHILILGLTDMGFTRDVVLIKDYSIGIKCFQLCNFESFYLCDFQFQLEFSNKMLSRILPSIDSDVKRKFFFQGT